MLLTLHAGDIPEDEDRSTLRSSMYSFDDPNISVWLKSTSVGELVVFGIAPNKTLSSTHSFIWICVFTLDSLAEVDISRW